MRFFGLHIIDWLIIFAYFMVLVYIGKWTRKRIKNTKDFYQGGRSFGKVLVAFITFGNMASADQEAAVTREIYRQGMQGMWFQNLTLFHTPFQWFLAVFQRRARYIGPGDLYEHRFESKFLAGLFAAYLLISAIYGNSFGYLITGKTIQAMLVKPASEYTPEERRSVEEFQEYQALKKRQSIEQLSEQDLHRLEVLREKDERHELNAYIPYISLFAFFILYAGGIGVYMILGGMFAAAFADVIQGVMKIFLSVALIPVGLSVLGGFKGLHARVPDYMFQLFGSDVTSEYTWYFVAAMATLNLIVNAPRDFTVGGSPKDDNSARIGYVTGSLTKRFMMVAWSLTGLIAIGLFAGQLDDPTYIWGYMTRNLLGVGFVGLMIAGIFAANMSTVSGVSLQWGAAFTKNILLPWRPQTSERNQLLWGRVIILIVLGASIYFALTIEDIFVVFKYVLSIGTVIGPAIWLVYFWRRLTTKAVVTQMILSILVTIALPNILPEIPGMREHPALTIQTKPRVEMVKTQALREDVEAGVAKSVGETIEKRKVAPPSGIFYETVVRENPNDPNSKLVGQGMFRMQVYLVSLLGVDFTQMSKSQVSTVSFLFDIIFPFVILFGVSLFTKRNSEKVLREFYACIHTPCVADQTEDARRVQMAIDNPEIVEKDKVFPGTDWEFWKPTKMDVWGFIVLCLLVLVVIGLFYLVATVGG
jgi:SSS family solute:Na+ symporter